MKTKPQPENILRLMRPEDRKAIGQQTQAEAEAAFVARNERELQDQLVALLHRCGVRFVHRSRMDKATTANVGTPDLLFTLRVSPGTYSSVAWEVKHGTNKPTADQVRVMADMRADGWETAVIYKYEDAKEHLRQLGFRPLEIHIDRANPRVEITVTKV